jgi:hypothetical protein
LMDVWGLMMVGMAILIVCFMIVVNFFDSRGERRADDKTRARIRDRRIEELERELFPEWFVVDERLPVGSPGRHAPECECMQCQWHQEQNWPPGNERKGW